jgi:hypothetical protein
MEKEKEGINKQAHNSVLVQLKKAQARNPLWASWGYIAK